MEHSGANMTVMVEDAELAERRVNLALGPDVPSQMIFILLPACAVALVAVIGAAASWLSGPAVVAGAAMVWYGWQAGRRTRVELTPDLLHVDLPIRSLKASWAAISEASLRGGLNVTFADGSRFTSPLYSKVLGAEFLARYLHIGRRRLATSRSLEAALQGHAQELQGVVGSVSRTWHWPSATFCVLAVVLAVLAEAVALSA